MITLKVKFGYFLTGLFSGQYKRTQIAALGAYCGALQFTTLPQEKRNESSTAASSTASAAVEEEEEHYGFGYCGARLLRR